MNFIRISTGTDKERTQEIAKFLQERFKIDRFEIEEKKIDNYLDDLVIAIVTSLRANSAKKLEKEMQTAVTIFRLAYDRGHEIGYEAGHEKGYQEGSDNAEEVSSLD